MIVHVLPDIPRLSWLLTIGPTPQEATLLCGTQVEVLGNGFFEGVWAGDFATADFLRAAEVFGSGAIMQGSEWVIVPPSQLLEGVFLLKAGGTVYASNSISFLLTRTGEALSREFLGYVQRLRSFINGIQESPIQAPLGSGDVALYCYLNNVRVGSDLSVSFVSKPEPPVFKDYASYIGYLQTTVDRLVENAAAGSRRHAFSLLATVSSGYDSPAGAVLAKRAGCTHAVTLAHARTSLGREEEDSGKAVADRLGLHCIECSRDAYLERAGEEAPEAEFWAHGLGGQDINLLAFEDHLPARILLTGFHGDTVWSPAATPTARLVRGDPAGASLGEFRLRVGFAHVPVPLIAARRHPDIHRISTSAEMAPYTIGTAYDRPIPRRLVEEAGVPRDAFGQSKKATTVLFHVGAPMLRDLFVGGGGTTTKAAERGVRAFCSEWHPSPATRMALARNGALSLTLSILGGASSKAGGLATRLRLDRAGALAKALGKAITRRGENYQDVREALARFHWGLAETSKRYRPATGTFQALRQAQPEAIAGADLVDNECR